MKLQLVKYDDYSYDYEVRISDKVIGYFYVYFSDFYIEIESEFVKSLKGYDIKQLFKIVDSLCNMFKNDKPIYIQKTSLTEEFIEYYKLKRVPRSSDFFIYA